MFVGSKPKNALQRKNLAAADFFRRQQQKRIHAQGPYLKQRSFRRNEGTTDYATIPEVTLAGDFVIEFDFLTLGDGKFFSGTDVGNAELVVEVLSGTVRVFAYNSSAVYQGAIEIAGGYNDGKLHHVKISMTGTSISVVIDDSLSSSGVFSTLDYFGISNIYRRSNNTGLLAGILANLKIYDDGTLVRDYPINDGKNILANVATALGNEIDGLTYALTTAIGGVASVVLTSLSVIGKTYLVEVSYSGVVGDASVRIGGFSSPSFTGTGSHSFVATAITTVNDILGALTGVTSGSVTVSIKEAEGYGTIVNGNADDWGVV